MSYWKNKTAIITGGGFSALADGRCGSIGYGIATAYAKEGANLVITGRNVGKLEKAKFTPSEENSREAEKLEKCDLLIIDDLGTELPGQFVTAALYSLLNTRLLAKKPMIITTNLNVDEAAERYSGQIASRLYGEFKRLTFLGSDIRIMKSRE